MPKFKYQGINADGKRIIGTLEAVGKNQVASHLKRNNINVLAIKELKQIDWDSLLKGNKCSQDDVIMFTRLLSGALRNGMNLREALEIIYRQVTVPVLKKVILKILNDIKSGVDMSATIALFPKIFPPYYAPLIKAGEASGKIEDVLDQISEYMEKLNDLRKEIKGMLTYPIVVLTIGVGLVVVVLVKVMPTFKGVFEQMGKDTPLPLPTRVLNGLSDGVLNHSQIIIAVIAAVVVGWIAFSRTPRGRYVISTLALKAPIVGPIIKTINIINFLKTLSTLTRNSVPIVHSLNIIQNSTNNVIIKSIVREMKNNVVKGLNLAAPLHQHDGIFPPMVAYAVDIGERSGNLGEVLSQSAIFYDKQSIYELKQLEAKVSPALTMLIAGLVLWVALAIYLPMFQMIQSATS